jgi:plasmid stabilization system protein ParE
MSLPLVINPKAEADLAEAKAWYEGERDEAFGQIHAMPNVCRKVYRDLRRTLVRRFPYAVFYRIDEDQITVVAVYHCKRDPRGWQKRA